MQSACDKVSFLNHLKSSFLKRGGFGSLLRNSFNQKKKKIKNTFLESLLKSSLSFFGGIRFMVLAKKLATLNLYTHHRTPIV